MRETVLSLFSSTLPHHRFFAAQTEILVSWFLSFSAYKAIHFDFFNKLFTGVSKLYNFSNCVTFDQKILCECNAKLGNKKKNTFSNIVNLSRTIQW